MCESGVFASLSRPDSFCQLKESSFTLRAPRSRFRAVPGNCYVYTSRQLLWEDQASSTDRFDAQPVVAWGKRRSSPTRRFDPDEFASYDFIRTSIHHEYDSPQGFGAFL